MKISRQKAKEDGVEGLVRIEWKNFFTADLSEVDVLTLYLLPVQNEKLIPQLEMLKPGSRIVAHEFPIPDVEPDKVIKVRSSDDEEEHTLYLWTTPLTRKK